MNIEFLNENPESWQADTAIALCFEGEKPAIIWPQLDKACPWLAIAPALVDFHGKKDESVFLYGHPELRLPRVLAIGLGKKQDASIQNIRQAVAKGAKKCRDAGLTTIILPGDMPVDWPGGQLRLLEECVNAIVLGLYQFTEFKTKNSENQISTLYIATNSEKAELRAAVNKGNSSALATSLARDLANMPGNRLYPETFALRASELSQNYNLDCKIFDEEALKAMGAGGLLAVGHGSAHAPRLITIEYCPAGQEQEKPLILVGKGITFDSGGLCLKPATKMNQMKCDMSGAAAVLGAICATARENINRRLVAIMACAENMPDGNAYRPGDIIYALNGESVEVINTDAEGRLVLADALAYCQKHWQPQAIIDIATLTGACAVALGNSLAGLFSNDDKLADITLSVGQSAGENFWRLPLWEKYRESLKSKVADISHTASREGGAITAALFLQNFILPGISWAHMDIAGVDWVDKDTPLCPEGASGFGARTLLELARGCL